MKVTVRATRVGTIGEFDKTKPYLQLVDTSQDVEAIKEYFGHRPAVKQFDGFLVSVEDGDYSEVYGFEGNIAYVGKSVYKITRTFTEDKPTRKATKKSKPKPRKGAGTPTLVRGIRR